MFATLTPADRRFDCYMVHDLICLVVRAAFVGITLSGLNSRVPINVNVQVGYNLVRDLCGFNIV